MVKGQENLKLAAFLFNHRMRCTFDWEVTGVCEDSVHLASQRRLEDEYDDTDMLLKVNNMAGTMKAIKEYIRSCHGVVRAHLAYIKRKTIIVQTDGDYPKYAAPDNEMIVRMLQLPLDKNNLHNEKSAQSVKAHTVGYEMTFWIIPAGIPICIHMTISKSLRGMQDGHLCHPLQVARPKLCQCNYIRS